MVRSDMNEISDQLERDVNAAAVMVKRFGQLAEYCAARSGQQALFGTPDSWNSRQQSYLKSKQVYSKESEKLATLL